MVNTVTRRKFGRVVGTTAGIAGVSGISSAADEKEDQDEPQSNVELRHDRTVEDGKVYVIAIARNTDTGETEAAAFVRPTGSSDSKESDSEQSETGELLDISDDVVDDIEATVFDNQSERKANTEGELKKSSGSEQTDIWGPIREKTQPSGITTQQKNIIQDVLEEIAAGAKESVNRVGFYFIDSPDGTDCDAEITDQHPHRQLGVSIDYDEDIGNLTVALITPIVSGIIGTVYSGTPVGGIGAGLLGAVVGFGINELKDTSNITVAYRDIDKSAFGKTDAAIQPLVSGIWMDEDTDMLTYTADYPLVHLEDAPVDVEVGAEETFNQ